MSCKEGRRQLTPGKAVCDKAWHMNLHEVTVDPPPPMYSVKFRSRYCENTSELGEPFPKFILLTYSYQFQLELKLLIPKK